MSTLTMLPRLLPQSSGGYYRQTGVLCACRRCHRHGLALRLPTYVCDDCHHEQIARERQRARRQAELREMWEGRD